MQEYKKPEAEVVIFETVDVVATSVSISPSQSAAP